jgi:hypothetical protein
VQACIPYHNYMRSISCLSLVGLLLLSRAIAACGPTDPAERARREIAEQQAALLEDIEDNPDKYGRADTWEVQSWSDGVRDDRISAACRRSKSKIHQEFPYEPTYVELCFRRGQRGPLDAYVQLVYDGQLICAEWNNCRIPVRIGDGEMRFYDAGKAGDGSSDILFLSPAAPLLRAANKSTPIRLEVTLYQSGAQVIEFDTAGLSWEHQSVAD